jgi:ferredoxin
MTYIIAELCINTKDTACDVCPVDCIHPRKDEAGFAERAAHINPESSTWRVRAGMPQAAIFPEEEVPENGRASSKSIMTIGKSRPVRSAA